MRGVLAVDEAFCLISHYPRDSHAPLGIRRPGAGAARPRVSCIDALPASNAGVGVALVGSAASRSGAGAGPRVSRDATRADARPVRDPGRAQRGGPPPRRRTPSGHLYVRLCERVTVRLKISMR